MNTSDISFILGVIGAVAGILGLALGVVAIAVAGATTAAIFIAGLLTGGTLGLGVGAWITTRLRPPP